MMTGVESRADRLLDVHFTIAQPAEIAFTSIHPPCHY